MFLFPIGFFYACFMVASKRIAAVAAQGKCSLILSDIDNIIVSPSFIFSGNTICNKDTILFRLCKRIFALSSIIIPLCLSRCEPCVHIARIQLQVRVKAIIRQFLFLQVYYARITEFLRFQPSPLQRSIDTG